MPTVDCFHGETGLCLQLIVSMGRLDYAHSSLFPGAYWTMPTVDCFHRHNAAYHRYILLEAHSFIVPWAHCSNHAVLCFHGHIPVSL